MTAVIGARAIAIALTVGPLPRSDMAMDLYICVSFTKPPAKAMSGTYMPFSFIIFTQAMTCACRYTVGVEQSFIMGTGLMPVPPPAPSKVSRSILAADAHLRVNAVAAGR